MKNKVTHNQKDYKPNVHDEKDDKIKIIYAADNRNRLNWGCRATSAAISMTLRKKYTIVHTITGKYTCGRYHPAILASLGGTPCIFFPSNSHKTLSIQYTLEYENVKEFSAFPNVNEFEDIFSLMDEKISSGLKERMHILNIVEELAEKAEQIFT